MVDAIYLWHDKFSKVQNLFEERPADINLKDVDGEWCYSPKEAMIRRRAVADKDTIGDIRITYQRADNYQEGRSVSVLGMVSEEGKLTPISALSTCISEICYGKADFINHFYRDGD